MERPPWQDAWEGLLDWLTNIVTPSWGDLIPVIPLAIVAFVVAVLLFIASRWRANAERNRSRVPPRRVEAAPPPGVHLPGPSIWPFVLPVAGAFLFAALAFRPRNEQGQLTDPFNWPLLTIGLVVGLVGVAGWLIDAGREYRQLEGDHHEPTNRDPRRAFPRSVASLYGGILAVALLVVAMPGLIALANPAPENPRASADPGSGGSGGPASITLIAQNVAWDKTELTVPADQPFQIAMENKDPAPHNVAIYESEERAQEFFNGELLNQPGTITYNIPALAAGPYYFICIVHPNMEGTMTAQ